VSSLRSRSPGILYLGSPPPELGWRGGGGGV